MDEGTYDKKDAGNILTFNKNSRSESSVLIKQ